MAPLQPEQTAMIQTDAKDSLPSTSSSSNRASIAGEREIIIDDKINNVLSTVEKPSLEAEKAAHAEESDDAGVEYPKGLRLVLIIFGLAMAVFLVFLDMTLIATAIPAITNQFNSLQHVGCGIIIGAWVVLAHSVPIRQRAVYTGFLGAFSGVGGIIGPLISGALTDSHLSWRWAFYVSIPIGVATLALIFFCFRPPQQPDQGQPRTLKQKLMEFDILGLSIFFACMICLLLALQWGGSQFAWNSAPMIGLLVAFGVLLITFIGVEIWKGDSAALPPRLMKMRNIAFACFYAACIDAAYYTADIWLPIWFQAIKGESARESGIKLVPYVGGEVLAALTAGYLVTYTGWFNPFMLVATVLGSLGLGLMTTFELDTGPSKWVTFPVIAGVGIGLGSQQPMMGVQSTLALSDIPAGTAAVTLFQNLGPAILMSVANTVFANGLTKHLHGTGGLDGQTIADMGATNLKDMISKDLLPVVIEAYNKALKETFTVPMAVTVISIIGVIGMKWEKLPG
ncbi:MFS transporter [Colletotrichum nymphaeae SA-01]|uniref:MFS transporter n=1 Tax=Colletotrichum nymphaeae SA-01 TaxID=1460502 RepID=A0A135UVX8_9PEZI|nr:MFS transporter [Colletotrichum nymphaeae SA-01]